MSATPRVLMLAGAAVLAGAVTPTAAHAYIDPISGSIILQVIAAVILGISLGVKRSWQAITGALRRVWARLRG